MWSNCLLDLGTDFLVGNMVFVSDAQYLAVALHFHDLFFLWSSAVRFHDSEAYRKMDVTRERISRILELREILLSIQTGFSVVNAAVVCSILESISGLEPSSVIFPSFCPFTLISVLMPYKN